MRNCLVFSKQNFLDAENLIGFLIDTELESRTK